MVWLITRSVSMGPKDSFKMGLICTADSEPSRSVIFFNKYDIVSFKGLKSSDVKKVIY